MFQTKNQRYASYLVLVFTTLAKYRFLVEVFEENAQLLQWLLFFVSST